MTTIADRAGAAHRMTRKPNTRAQRNASVFETYLGLSVSQMEREVRRLRSDRPDLRVNPRWTPSERAERIAYLEGAMARLLSRTACLNPQG
jgi:hypothetical protein